MRKQTRMTLLHLLLFVALLWGTLPPQAPLALAAAPPPVRAGQAVTQTSLPQASTAPDLVAAALRYLQAQRARWGLTAADLADVVVTDRYVTQHNGVTHLYLRQRYQGIELFNGDMTLALNRDGQVLYSTSRFVPNLAGAVNTTRPTLSASQAVAGVAAPLHLQPSGPVQVLEALTGPAQEGRLANAGLSTAAIPAKLMYQRQADGTVRLVWNTRLEPPAQENVWLLNVDALTGAILLRHDLVVHERALPQTIPQATPTATPTDPPSPTPTPTTVTPTPTSPTATPTDLPSPTVTSTATPTPVTALYRVLPLPLENPEDGPGLPDTHSVVTDPADAVASPYGWHDVNGLAGAEFSDTRGNNVAAQEDHDADDSGGSRPGSNTPGQLVFDYAFAPAQEPTQGTNQAAAIVNLFYWNNLVHDLFYHYGFDEAAGNFQENNYGRGGAGGDAVAADAQDGSGTDNANFYTPVDGETPRMQMFAFTYTSPNRDSALDNGIIIHEYGHGISTRLTGGPANVDCLWNDEQMGEGWSDWLALALTAKASDTPTQARAMGTYVLGEPKTGNGIRTFPYSTDLAINPQTYDTIKASIVPHGVGEVWAQMLWEVYWALVQQYGFDPDFYQGVGGNNLAMQLVLDGMKLQPCEPGFVDGRDAILAADQINTGGANQCLLWTAFAKRGLGASAEQGSVYDILDGTEAFDLPTQCINALMLQKAADRAIAKPGDSITYTLYATNYTTMTLTNVVLSDTLPAGLTYVPATASDGGGESGGVVQWPAVTLAPDEALVRTFQAQIAPALPSTPTLFFDDMESGDNWTASGLWHQVTDSDPCANSFSPTTSWYYGQAADCTYDTGSANAGALTMRTPVTLLPGQSQLEFMSWQATEPFEEYDRPVVRISTDGVTFEDLWYWADNSASWQKITVDLSAYAGQPIWLQFALDTVDADNNQYPGWYIDDVRVALTVPAIRNVAAITAAEGDAASATATVLVLEPPANDDFDARTIISDTYFNDRVETTMATLAADDPGFPCTTNPGARTVWYEVTAPFGGLLRLNTADSNYRTLLGVWTGARGSLVNVACTAADLPVPEPLAPTGGMGQTKLETAIDAGVTYYVEVAEFQGLGLTAAGQGMGGGPGTERRQLQLAVELIPLPELALAPSAFEETIMGGALLTRTLWLSNTGFADLAFHLLERGTPWSMAPVAPVQVPGYAPTAQATAKHYAGQTLRTSTAWSYQAKPQGLISDTPIKVLLLAAAATDQLRAILSAYPDLQVVDTFDAGAATPTLEQLLSYDVVVVVADNAFANPWALGDVLADYVDVGGAVLQSVPTFYNPGGNDYALQGRFVAEEYSPFSADGDWFLTAELGDFLPTHPIMHGVTAARDALRQMVELTPGAAWVASWTDDELVATKGRVVGVNAFLADGFVWTGDIDLIVHNSIVWLHTQNRDVLPWLTATPLTGTVAVNAGQPVLLTFDAGGDKVDRAGDHYGALKVLTNDLDENPWTIPITLHVVGPELALTDATVFYGRALTVPLTLNTNGLTIAAATFAIDYDARCLTFDPTDSDTDGIPDALVFTLPAGFQPSVQVDLTDSDGEIDIFIGDLFPPITTLQDGVLATLTLTAACQPPQGATLDASVRFSTAPTASFSDPNGRAIPGSTVDGGVLIHHAVAGDCNHDGQVNAADTISCVLEIFDDDGNYWLDAPGGAFAGNPPGCDSNQDTIIDAADLICTTLIIFNGPAACRTDDAVAAASVANLALPATVTAPAGALVAVPVALTNNGQGVAAAVFAVDFDATHLRFDPSDSNGDDLPDAITLAVPADFTAKVMVDAARQQLQFVIADLTPPLATLPDGVLATIRFDTQALAQDSATPSAAPVTFATDYPASLSTALGQSLTVATSNGAVLLTTGETSPEQANRLYLPMIKH